MVTDLSRVDDGPRGVRAALALLAQRLRQRSGRGVGAGGQRGAAQRQPRRAGADVLGAGDHLREGQSLPINKCSLPRHRVSARKTLVDAIVGEFTQ